MIINNIFKHKKVFLILICLSLLLSQKIKAQILDVPYLNDLTICGSWCWAKSCQMVIAYYGHNIILCDVLEYARLDDTIRFGNDNCYIYPDSCCNSGYVSKNRGILQNWGIDNSLLGQLSLSEIQNCFQNNKPIIIHLFRLNERNEYVNGHSVVAYGINNNDIYIQNPGNGSEIRDYYDLITITLTSKGWLYCNRPNIASSSCLLVQEIIGALNSSTSKYKAISYINARCLISNNSEIEFECENEINLDKGFEIQEGSTLSITTGSTLNCP